MERKLWNVNGLGGPAPPVTLGRREEGVGSGLLPPPLSSLGVVQGVGSAESLDQKP